MSKTDTEKMNEICYFCKRKSFCKDSIMVKGINKLIRDVAPNLVLECTKYDSMLSNDPINPVTPLSLFVEKELKA